MGNFHSVVNVSRDPWERHPASTAFLLLTRFRYTGERLCELSKISIEHARHVAGIQLRTQA